MVTVDKENLDRVLKAALARREKWDEPPEVGVIYRPASGVLRLVPWKISQEVWQSGHPGAFLSYLADRFMEDVTFKRDEILNIVPIGGEALGIYFRHEGYTPPKDQAEELRRRRMVGASTPRFKDIPGRREYRMILGVTFELLERGALQYRETPPQPPHGYTVLDGPVATAMVRMATALKAEREDSE
ncbi:hypothetical protein ACFYP4_02975 [Streptomyces sp. NPDC005551]|uniref:hypothetical protein n=1 Tax=Streptomyces sp. NPDC005551 TaxID=3364725 RepID=UPI0036C6F4E8